MAPGDGVVDALIASFVTGFVQYGQHVDSTARIHPVIVPLVRAQPASGKHGCRRVHSVDYANFGGLYVRVTIEVRADQLAVPGPLILGVGRSVNADKPSSALNKALKCGLLVWVEYVSRRVEENDGSVVVQRLVVKYGAVFCRMDREAVGIPQAANGRYRGRNRVVSKTGRMGED